MMNERRRMELHKELKDGSELALERKKEVLDRGCFTPVPHILMREIMVELNQKYDGMTARDCVVFFMYLCSYVNGEKMSENYMWAYPTTEQIARDTGIHKDRIKKLCTILESENLVETVRIGWKGFTKKLYLPLLP